MPEALFLDQLQKELDAWQRLGFISASQARSISAHYGLALGEVPEERRRGRLVSVLGVLGALLTGLGVILFVGSNWQRIDRPYKILLLLVTLVAAYGVGYWLKYRAARPRLGAAFVFLGSLVFGANIFLIAQIYHVSVGEPLLVAFWAAGAFPLAYVAGSRPSLYLAILAAVAWYGFQLADWDVFAMGTPGVAGLAAFLPYGLLILSLGEFQRSFRNTQGFSGAFVQLGLVVAFLTLLVFTSADFWRFLAYGLGGARAPGTAATPVNFSFAVFAGLAFVFALAVVIHQGLSRASLSQGIGVLALGLSSLIVVFHPFGNPEAYAISFNLVLLAGILWVVILGIWTQRESLVNIGLVFFVFLALARYFDFAFTLMDRSLFFVGAGLLLMGAGYVLEQYRRRLIGEMHRPGEPRLEP